MPAMARLTARLPQVIALGTVLMLPVLYANGEWLAARLTERTLALWLERGQRVPKLVWNKPARTSSISTQSRTLTARAVLTRTVGRYVLPEDSLITQVVHTPMGWVAVTFDAGAWVLNDGAVQPLPFGQRVNEVQVHQDNLWAATDEGLYTLRSNGSAARVASGTFTSLASWQGGLWALSRAGVSHVANGQIRTWGKSFGFDADAPSVLRVCGTSLCACATNGVFAFDGQRFTRHSAAGAQLPNDFATELASDGTVSWVGTFDAGLAHWHDGHIQRWTPLNGLPDGRVQPRSLVATGLGAVFGTPSGLYSVQGDTLSEWRLEGQRFAAVSALAAGDQGRFWVGLKGQVLQVELTEEPQI
ncbi:MAG: hypothetical protein K1X64_13390 [Myxococcaceae bacterium]|nr:hypothetical protein [Myxococcaceae bacterium]